jgi:hypothetical protein
MQKPLERGFPNPNYLEIPNKSKQPLQSGKPSNK